MLRLLVRAFAFACAAFAFSSGEVTAQGLPSPGPSVALPSVALMPPVWLRALDVHAGTVQSLAVPVVPPALVGIDVTFAGQVHTLELAPFDVRSPSFQLLERGAFGLQPVTAPAATTFRGAVVGEAGSAVAASIDGGTLRAYVRRGSGELWIVQPLSDVLAGAPAAAHAVFRGADSAPANGRCGVTDGARPVTPMMGGIDVTYLCDLALEADHPLFVINGSNLAATQNDVLGVVNAIDLIYRTDVQVTLQVSQLIVDSVPDAYSSNVAGTLLTQFRGHWNANYGGITRDVAHLFSGRPLGANSGGTIGIAYVGVVCDLPNAYGVSQTRWSANFAYRVGLTAHELGHNFNASHCDGQPTCSIMCSVVGGCTNNPGAFSVNEQAQIIAYRQNANCLVLQAVQPGTWVTLLSGHMGDTPANQAEGESEAAAWFGWSCNPRSEATKVAGPPEPRGARGVTRDECLVV